MELFSDKIYRRQSNIELLRVVSMFMILVLHSFSTPPHLQDIDIVIFTNYFVESFCICAVNMFVITSGYFSIKPNRRSLVRLLYQVYFYAIVVFCIFIIFNIPYSSNVNWWIILNAVPSCWWFIATYMVLYLISPILNKYVESVDKRTLKYMLITYFAVLIYYSLNSVKETLGFNNVFLFIGLYLIGRYIKIYYTHRLKNWQTAISYIFITLCIAVYAILCKKYLNDGSSIFFLKGGIYSNPLVVIQATIGFLFFAHLKIKSVIINYISISALSVYLIHMHPAVKEYYYDYCQSLYTLSPPDHYLKLVFLLVGVFIASIIVDKFRILMTDCLYKLIRR